MISQENRKLIEEFLEGIQGIETLSVKSYLDHGRVSGSLLNRLDSMLEQKELIIQQRLKADEREYYCSAISQGWIDKNCLINQCDGCKRQSDMKK